MTDMSAPLTCGRCDVAFSPIAGAEVTWRSDCPVHRDAYALTRGQRPRHRVDLEAHAREVEAAAQMFVHQIEFDQTGVAHVGESPVQIISVSFAVEEAYRAWVL